MHADVLLNKHQWENLINCVLHLLNRMKHSRCVLHAHAVKIFIIRRLIKKCRKI